MEKKSIIGSRCEVCDRVLFFIEYNVWRLHVKENIRNYVYFKGKYYCLGCFGKKKGGRYNGR